MKRDMIWCFQGALKWGTLLDAGMVKYHSSFSFRDGGDGRNGADYAVSVADAIAELLTDMKELLSSCDCGSACSKCLKHYRNQYVHGMLNRFVALQLLEWDINEINASPNKPETQIKMVTPLVEIL